MGLGISVRGSFDGGCSHMVSLSARGPRWLREWATQSGKPSAPISQVGGLSGTAESHPERGVLCSNRRAMMSWPQTAARILRSWLAERRVVGPIKVGVKGVIAVWSVGSPRTRGPRAQAWMSLADTNNLHIAGHIDGESRRRRFGNGMRLGGALGRRHRAALAGYGGNTVSPVPPPAVIMVTANREGKILRVMGGRSYTSVLFCLYRLGFWARKGRTST